MKQTTVEVAPWSMRIYGGSLLVLVTTLLVVGTACGGEMLEEGVRFPDFQLTNHHGEIVSSADLEGSSYLVYFYPKAATPG